MTGILSSVRLAAAITMTGLCMLAWTWAAVPAGAARSDGTPLPSGWELCVLQGLNAPASQANVADL
ncbi:MAG TPA: hypothetical protein VEH82_11615, partial [Acidimicrobiales bacterium]|nr:hypothetical protein [Acidimicrobiales bacterium]